MDMEGPAAIFWSCKNKLSCCFHLPPSSFTVIYFDASFLPYLSDKCVDSMRIFVVVGSIKLGLGQVSRRLQS